MRHISCALLVTLLCVSSAFAQHPYDLDPYKPSDAAWLRSYGSVLVGLTPLLELRKLDPYVPSHAALLRQLGGALPLWVGWYPPVPVPASGAPLTPFAATQPPPRPASNTIVILVPPRNTQPPPGGFQDRGVPQPRPRRVSPRIQAARKDTNAKIHVRCEGTECRWSITSVANSTGEPSRTTCGWMPKGGTFEAGGPLACEEEPAAP
jgi:hypothetical protein